MKTANGIGMGLAATFGLSALLVGLAGATPARADSWDDYGRNHVYSDIADVRRDERTLRDLQAEHDEARRCHDWNRMHALDRRIAALRRHINDDRRDIRIDVNLGRDRGQIHYSDRSRGDRYSDSRYNNDRYRDDRSRDDRNRDDRGRYRDDRYNR